MKKVYETRLIPKWLKQSLSDILIFLGQNLPHPRLRIFIWKIRGAKLQSVNYIGMNCLIGNHPWLLTMKRNVTIASGTRILTEDASYQNTHGLIYQAETILEENVHVGMNCIIGPGVTIGKNSIVGAGSVVLTSIPENSIASGNPARVFLSVKAGAEILKTKLGLNHEQTHGV